MPEHEIHIDPAKIRDSEYDTACRTLAACIRRALANPEKNEEYRAWKAARGGENHEKQRT